jgi:hypothetical protein
LTFTCSRRTSFAVVNAARSIAACSDVSADVGENAEVSVARNVSSVNAGVVAADNGRQWFANFAWRLWLNLAPCDAALAACVELDACACACACAVLDAVAFRGALTWRGAAPTVFVTS